ncbi:MAG TPA: beta-ketoacyl-[acyl-carrier-protein] synthase family protein [Ferruginibacter sp.]|jgi:3-oxoacyl-(acyl-carrier-protein) synthase|nr:beta-ketoacyl-[acyl-carrier-protein] synthase family protein [Ferruginibacter sp.]
MSRIFITGMGAISAIGNSVAENHRALIESTCGVHFGLDLFPTKYAAAMPFGQVRASTEDLRKNLNITEKGVTRTSMLALHAFNEAIADSGMSTSTLEAFDTALIGASTVGGMCLTDELYNDANKEDNGSEFTSSYDCASINMFLQQRYQMKGIINTINTACSSSANAIMFGAMLIRNGLARRAIVGGVDSLSKFTINGFNALYILSPENCTPFDADRKGLNLGEGAAFLVLEKEEDIAGRKVYAELAGYCNANDAFHPSSLSDQADGPFLSMQGALKSAELDPGQIDFINAHGTGTENNDEAESKAMLRLFDQPPAFASSKGNIGHTLGAAGAIEAVYSILSLVNQEVYPNLHFSNPIPSTGLTPVTAYTKMPVQHIMSNSFGFGGNCSSLIFSKA